MADSVWISAAAEGIVDEAAIRRLAAELEIPVAAVHLPTPGGKHQLDRRLRGYNAAAVHAPWLVLRDLDHDASCPAELVSRKLPDRHPGLLFRIAVRSLEAWLLADADNLGLFLGVAEKHFPDRPDDLDRPKRTIIDLARRSRRRGVHGDLIPEAGISSEVGPGYSAALIEFIQQSWDPQAAAERSPSLYRCLRALNRLKSR